MFEEGRRLQRPLCRWTIARLPSSSSASAGRPSDFPRSERLVATLADPCPNLFRALSAIGKNLGNTGAHLPVVAHRLRRVARPCRVRYLPVAGGAADAGCRVVLQP